MRRRRWLLMIAGCLMPVILLAVVFRSNEVGSLLLLGFLLLCPAVHLLLMRDHLGFSHTGSDDARVDYD